MEQYLPEILEIVRTKEEAEQFLSQVELVLESYFQVGEEKRKEILEGKLPYKTSVFFKKILDAHVSDHTAFEKSLNEIKEKVQSLPMCSLTIAFVPRGETVSQFISWVRSNFSKEAILDISTDPSILGGAKIAMGGKYKDLSVSNRLQALFETEKQDIVNIAKAG
jgi:F0F1-type ATP synthase delta subunit